MAQNDTYMPLLIFYLCNIYINLNIYLNAQCAITDAVKTLCNTFYINRPPSSKNIDGFLYVTYSSENTFG